jgi:F0F1-type ATP synthase epsilon subunit
MSAELTKEDHIVNYIKSIATIEEAMVPYKEQRKDLRKSYVDNGWLEKEDIKVAIRAYRLMKQDVDFDELRQTYRTIKQQKNVIGIVTEDEED